MTTNVYDLGFGLLTTDSRWSLQDGHIIAYVDDTGYDKLVYDNQLAILFAGDLCKIEEWKSWFKAGRIDNPPTDTTGISMIICNVINGDKVFNSDYLLESHEGNKLVALYGGSGSSYAKDCWEVNKCAATAVNTAMSYDVKSGGKVVFFNRVDFDNNIDNSTDINDIRNIFIERGMMINTNTLERVSIKDAANDTNDAFKNMANRVISGNVELSAPFPGMTQPWTNEKKEELKQALNKFKPKI